MKRIIALLVVLITVSVINVNVAAASPKGVTIILNGETQHYDQPPIVQKGRTLVPLRGIFESLGAKVNWNQQQKKVTATKNNKIIELRIGSNMAQINSKVHSLEVPAQVLDGRTMIPLRFISEALDANVKWVGSTQTILIESIVSNPTPTPTPPVTDKPAVPTGVKAAPFENSMAITWDNAPNVDYYHIYYSNYAEGPYYPFGKDGSIDRFEHGLKHYLNPGDTVYYKVKAVKNGVESDFSKVVSATMPMPAVPPVINRSSLILVADDRNKTYLGKATTNTYDSESIFNEYGSYGSKYGQNSIWNNYGNFGSPYATYSAFNEYASKPPILIDQNGEIRGKVTANPYVSNGIHPNRLYDVLKRNGY